MQQQQAEALPQPDMIDDEGLTETQRGERERQRKQLCRSLVPCMVWDVMLLIYSLQSLRLASDKREECGEDLHTAVLWLIGYYSWFIVRNIVITCVARGTNRPFDTQNFMRMCCFGVDAIGLTMVNMFLSDTLASEQV